MIDTAVILAAGLGSRLKKLTEKYPKGFIEINGISLIERSINCLKSCEIKNILIGTGYKKENFELVFSKRDDIEFIFNPIFANTGSMYTLYNMREKIKEDFLLLESDLLYEKLAQTSLIESTKENIILASSFTKSGDEVFIQINNDGYLEKLSKNIKEISPVYGELVGINKISIKGYNVMCDYFSSDLDNTMLFDYEKVMMDVQSKIKFDVLKIDNLVWCEIDDENHLNRAFSKIYPKL